MPDVPNLTFEEFAATFAEALEAQNGGRIRQISYRSRVCREGGIAGDDFPELLERIHAIYGTDFDNIPPYGGDEATFAPYELYKMVRMWWRGEQEADVTVGELYEAVKAGSWKRAFPDRVEPYMDAD